MQKALNKYEIKSSLTQSRFELTTQSKKPSDSEFLDKKSLLGKVVNKLRTIARLNMRLVPATLAVLIQCAALLTAAAIIWAITFA